MEVEIRYNYDNKTEANGNISIPGTQDRIINKLNKQEETNGY